MLVWILLKGELFVFMMFSFDMFDGIVIRLCLKRGQAMTLNRRIAMIQRVDAAASPVSYSPKNKPLLLSNNRIGIIVVQVIFVKFFEESVC